MNLSYYFSTALRQIVRRSLTFICSTIIIAACMLMVSSCILTGLNVQRFMDMKLKQTDFTVVLKKGIPQPEIDILLDKIKALDTVSDATFNNEQTNLQAAVEKAQKYHESYGDSSEDAQAFMEDFFQSDAFQDLFLDDLPPTIAVQLTSFSVMPETVAAVTLLPGVDSTEDSLEIFNGFSMVNTVLQIALVLLLPTLSCLSLFIVYSFIQMSLIARSEEIQIMSIVGADPAFIRIPFLIEGAFLGLFGGSLGLLSQYGIHRLVFYILRNTGMYEYLPCLLRFREIFKVVVPGFLVTGTLMGILCARVALHWLIRPAELD